MLTTLMLSLLPMAGLFLMVFTAVALIQDKRMFTSAPKDIQQAIEPRTEERFSGAHAIGWALFALAVLLIVCPFAYGAWDGVRQGYGFGDFFARFAIMLLLLKAFDILFLDLFLLCHSHFYQHYYPETEGCEGFHSFGFNAKSHVVQIVVFIVAAALLAFVCTML